MVWMEIRDLRQCSAGVHRQAAELLYTGFKDHWPAAWPTVESAQDEVEECMEDERICLGLLDGQSLVGWIGGMPEYGGHVWELHPLVVDPAARCQGHGRRLVNALETEARAQGGLTLYLGSDDEDGMTSLAQVDLYDRTWEHIRDIKNYKGHPYQFYERLGFCIVGVVPDANGLGRPDILMAKSLVR